eukprot:m.232524 g.232524  ORF g.232524 m.232524 type:complete len:540 (-) comp18762_c0_seq1:26-1645(-)
MEEQLRTALEKGPVNGWLVGCGTARALVASNVQDEKLDLGKERALINSILPAGCVIQGLFVTDVAPEAAQALCTALSKRASDGLLQDGSLEVWLVNGATKTIEQKRFDRSTELLSPHIDPASAQAAPASHVLLHITGGFSVDVLDSLEAAEAVVRDRLSKTNIVFLFPRNQSVLRAGPGADIVLAGDQPVPVQVTESLGGGAPSAPALSYKPAASPVARITLAINTLALVPTAIRGIDLFPVLVRAVHTANTALFAFMRQNGGVPRTLHFHPAQCALPVSMVVPTDPNPSLELAAREALHAKLLLPLDRPLFRRGCALTWTAPSTQRLRNPHATLKPSGVNGVVSTVQGLYDYYHYNQDGIDDNGWGCAYRSLQTICSWYILQGYSARTVPSIREVQRLLVDLDLCPAAFYGSSKWIGSTELCWVLQNWFKDDFDIDHKFILNVPGSEMAGQARELEYHFKRHGTPVMIAGNARAHTILGVDYDSNLGKLKFLVLDPHYVGPEDIKMVHDKKWCAWHEPSFWKASSNYNMLLPQRPFCY